MLALALGLVLAAPAPGCAELAHLTSPGSTRPATFTLWNDTDREVTLEWLDFQGRRLQPRRIPAGERETVESLEGHRFVASAADGACLGVVEASGAAPVVRLSPTGLVSDPQAIAAMFERRTVAGFAAYVDRRALGHPETDEVLAFLESEIPACLKLMHAHAEALRPMALRIQWSPASEHSAGYRIGEREFLVRSAAQFLRNARTFEPMVVCHELAHAVNHLAFGEKEPHILAAYAEALDSEVYQHVEHDGRSPERAYALRSQDEYFAECTEAYLGYNDWYPHTREELRRFDPTGYALMERIWGPLPASPALALAPCPAPGALKSEGQERTSLRLHNAGARRLAVDWLDDAGRPRHIGAIEPGETKDVLTSVGHAFLLSDEAGRCLGAVRAERGARVVNACARGE